MLNLTARLWPGDTLPVSNEPSEPSFWSPPVAVCSAAVLLDQRTESLTEIVTLLGS